MVVVLRLVISVRLVLNFHLLLYDSFKLNHKSLWVFENLTEIVIQLYVKFIVSKR
jgi:hypothetical protein